MRGQPGASLSDDGAAPRSARDRAPLNGSLMDDIAHCPPLVGIHAWYRDACARLGGPPSRKDLDPVGFRFILGRELLIEYHRDGNAGRARYRLVGAEVNERGGIGEQSGRWLDETLR